MEKATSAKKQRNKTPRLKCNWGTLTTYIVVTAKPPLLLIHNMNSNVFRISDQRKLSFPFIRIKKSSFLLFMVNQQPYFDRCAKKIIMIAIQYEYNHTKI